ncbi:MAG: type I-B CRISPR-associated protein Cas7/Csh2 [Candidatus Thorarchaeota archaeon]|nr:type I-B CRISPR-associated protein Cas7/Csh2 [Candidatus Thorarchaeota archaeon]
MSTDILKNRHEILFLYDAKFVNPNGDPSDENRPRIDEETERNIVTDVRLKRTIRDYLYDFLKKEIFIRQIAVAGGEGIQDAKTRFDNFLEPFKGKKMKLNETIEKGKSEILAKCVDIRMFGALIPVEVSQKEKGALVLVGPTQFRMGRSLHKVAVKYIQGTGAFASQAGAGQQTFREEYVLPYSMIAFYGIVNENAAQDTQMTEDDMNLLLEGIWLGTKNLITRSKMGQTPHLLLDVVYNEKSFYHGDLDRLISLASELDDQEIRDPSEYTIEIGGLVKALGKIKDKIETVQIAVSDFITYTMNGKKATLKDSIESEGIKVKMLDL